MASGVAWALEGVAPLFGGGPHDGPARQPERSRVRDWSAARLGGPAPLHPSGEVDQIYLSLRDDVTAWLVVHIGMMLFIPLMAGGIYLLLRGVLKGSRRGSAGSRLSPSSSSSARGRRCRAPQMGPRERTEPPPGTGACGRVKVDSGLRGESLGPRSRRLREYRKRLDRDRDDRGRDCLASSRGRAACRSHPARLVRSPDRRPYPRHSAPSRSSASPPPWSSSGEADQPPWGRLTRETAQFRTQRGLLPHRTRARAAVPGTGCSSSTARFAVCRSRRLKSRSARRHGLADKAGRRASGEPDCGSTDCSSPSPRTRPETPMWKPAPTQRRA